MKYLPLVLAGLWRKPARTIFTFLSVVVAFILFGILSAIDGGMAHQLEAARLDRLLVDTKFGTQLPLAYLDQVARILGVTVVAPRQILVGYYQDPKTPFGIIMTDRRFFSVRPELNATKEQIDTLLKTRSGALVTVFSAKRFGWKVGQQVPIISNTPRRDGGHTWTFNIIGIIDDTDRPGKARYFISNYDYMDQERVTEKGTVDRILVRIKDPARATQIGRAIDRLFANSAAPTRTG
jgi:putative ABC transport system permease protein